MTKKRRNTARTIFLFLFLVLLCITSLLGIWGVDQVLGEVRQKYGPADKNLSFFQKGNFIVDLYLNGEKLLLPNQSLTNEEVFEISYGETVGQVTYRLEKEDIISDGELFRKYLIYRGYDRKIQAGVFWIEPNMNAVQLAEKLINSTPEKVQFNILPGWRSEEIAAALPRSGLSIDPMEFLSVVRNPPAQWLPEGFPKVLTLEGYLFPDVYIFDRNTTLHDFIQTITDNFSNQISGEMINVLYEKDISLQEAIILASIVERESILDEEMPLIASVFINREKIGMKLDSDATVQYALGYNQVQGTWWTNPLSSQDLQVNSPFNTYQNSGLPPAAISNPSLTAIQSIAFAADTPYYYFRARCDGSGFHDFAVTFEEHLSNGCSN